MGVPIDTATVNFVFGMLAAGAAVVVFLWTRLSALRSEIVGGCSGCRAEYHARLEQVRVEIQATIVRMHERLDDMQAEKVDRGDLAEIRADIRRLGDQLALLNANLPKFMAGFRPAE